MKKLTLNLFCILALAMALSSCKDDKDEPVYGEAKMTSFGFYAEDNQGKIFKDYIASDVTTDMNILLPDYVDKSELIARFEVTESDVVTIGTITQESGKTANNFTIPVDYIVTEGTNNTKYTVTVGKLPAAVWTKAATLPRDMRELTLRVNPKTNEPYLAYIQSASSTEEYKTGVFKLSEGQLVSVGPEFISSGRSSYCSIAFSTDGIPYVSFADYTNTISPSLSVAYLNGSSWDYVGGNAGKGITDAKTSYTEVVLKADGQPMCFSVNSAAGTLGKRELNISDYNGTSWTTSMAMPGRLATQNTYLPKAKLVNGVLYFGVYNVESGVGTFSVYKYENGSWTTLVNAYMDEGVTTANLRDFDMSVDLNGTIYVAYADDQSGAGLYYPKVKKYEADTKKWVTVANSIPLDLDDIREFSLAVSPAGVPFLLYRNASNFPEVVSFDNETKDWTTPFVLDNIETENLSIDFASDGVGYAAYSSVTSDGITLCKFDVPAQ